MKTMTRAVLGTAGLALVAAACSHDISAPPEPSADLNLDVASVAAAGAIQDLDLMKGQGIPGIVFAEILFPPFVGDHPPCPFHAGAYDCPALGRDGLTFTRTVTFYDGSGAVQEAFDSASTAAIAFDISIAGTMTNQVFESTVDRHRQLTVTGLQGSEVTWNGTGTGKTERTSLQDPENPRAYEMTSNSTVADVVVPNPRGADAWPLSGTITRTMTVEVTAGPDQGQTVNRTAVVTFNGTQYVPLTVDGETYTIDLAARQAPGPRGGRGPRGPHGPQG